MAKIKFCNLPIGAKFKHNDIIYIKVDDYFVYDFKSTLLKGFYYKEKEIELVNKCVNCKWFDRNSKLMPYELPEDKTDYCHKMGILICGDDYYCLNADKETFSCSLFEQKI